MRNRVPKKEYRVEVYYSDTLLPTEDGEGRTGESIDKGEIWLDVCQGGVFGNRRAAEGYRDDRQRRYPNSRYRIVCREVGEWIADEEGWKGKGNGNGKGERES